VGRLITARQDRRLRIVESLALDPHRRPIVVSLTARSGWCCQRRPAAGLDAAASPPPLPPRPFCPEPVARMHPALIKTVTGAKPDELPRFRHLGDGRRWLGTAPPPPWPSRP
jgi:hypothetical protein